MFPELRLDNCLKRAAAAEPTAFPGNGSVDYFTRYSAIREALTNHIYPHVTAGAVLIDGEGYLTDHGEDHVMTVVDRASRLTATDTCTLTPYETYILLVAIHLHDVGNIYGRKGHEMRPLTIMREVLGNIAGMDSVEKRHIFDIAQAHGGHIAGDKDKIRRLERETLVLQQRIRPQLLAAILRFADELADDRHRASRFMLGAGLIPKPSEIYHKFAESLHTVEIDHAGRQVLLHFDFTDADAMRTFGKGDTVVYLLDEIYDRTIKTHMERVYCMRFMYHVIPIDVINVKIEVTHNRNYNVLHALGYRLEDTGYPDAPAQGVRSICRDDRAGAMTGAALRELLAPEASI
jgi:hypothetical protein